MATGDTLSGQKTKLWIVAADSTYTTLAADTTSKYEAEATNWNKGGGATDVTSEAVFGGFIDLTKPQEQIELSVDIILRHGTAKRWHDLTTSGLKYMVVLQNSDGAATTPNYYWEAYNNARVINLESEFAADDNWRGTITFKLSPATPEGVDNIQVGEAGAASAATNGVVAWV